MTAVTIISVTRRLKTLRSLLYETSHWSYFTVRSFGLLGVNRGGYQVITFITQPSTISQSVVNSLVLATADVDFAQILPPTGAQLLLQISL